MEKPKPGFKISDSEYLPFRDITQILKKMTDEEYESIFIIDDLLISSGFMKILSSFNEVCVFECCGTQALEFSRKNIKILSQNFNDKDVLSTLSTLKKFLNSYDSELITSNLVDFLVHKNTLEALILHMEMLIRENISTDSNSDEKL